MVSKAMPSRSENRTTERVQQLLTILSDGHFHSGQSIAGCLGVSRTAVWKLIQKLQAWQLEVFSISGKGYQIPGGLELINADSLKLLMQQRESLFQEINVLTSTDSTSDQVARHWKKHPGVACVFIAEHQTAGRGRKGRPWISPLGANLYFSIGVELPLGLSALGGLSLAIGISLVNALNSVSNQPIKIKWPNDLLVEGKKLAGILIEASGDSNDSSFLNIGVGINWNMQQQQGEPIDQSWVNLKPLISSTLSRNDILLLLLSHIEDALKDYRAQGFSAFEKLWPEVSYFYEQPVTISFNEQLDGISGTEVGVESTGALKLRVGNNIKVFHSGEVSLRAKLIRNSNE